MKRLLTFSFWGFLFLGLLLATDQLLLRVEIPQSSYTALRTFYIDFRQRLIVGPGGEKATVNSPVVAKKPPPAAPALTSQAAPVSPPAPSPPAASGGYFYADAQGELLFVDRLDEVPEAYRDQAQPLQ